MDRAVNLNGRGNVDVNAPSLNLDFRGGRVLDRAVNGRGKLDVNVPSSNLDVVPHNAGL